MSYIPASVSITEVQFGIFMDKVQQMWLQVRVIESEPMWVEEDLLIPPEPLPWIPVPFVPTGQPNLYASDSDLATTEELSVDSDVDSDSDVDFAQIDFSEEINLNDLY